MAGEIQLLQTLAKRAKIRQDANRNPSRLAAQRLKNSGRVDVPPDTSEGNRNLIDENVSTPTQSELQDIRGVPDQEFDQLKERDKPGPMLHERFPDPTERLIAILRARKIAPTSVDDPRGLSKVREGIATPNDPNDQVRQFFQALPNEERESLLFELLGGTVRNPE